MGDELLDFIPLGTNSDPEDEIENGHVGQRGSHPTGSVNEGSEFDDTPWRTRNYTHKEVACNLHTEIIDYVAWLRPTPLEHQRRLDLIERLKDVVRSIWGDAELCVFGSVATGLYLPNGDIDLVVLSKTGNLKTQSNLHKLSRKIVQEKISENTVVVGKAKVPIVKFQEIHTGIQFDVAFEEPKGVRAITYIQRWLEEWPGLEFLIFIIKAFLRERNLNEVYEGGLGSLSIICLLVSFLQLHPKVSTNEIRVDENLGVLLLEFLELYGFNFNYNDVTLDPQYARYLKKPQNYSRFGQEYLLNILDPLDSSNNISKSSREMMSVRAAFGDAYEDLLDALYVRRFNGSGVLHTILPNRFNRPPLAARDSTVIYRPADRAKSINHSNRSKKRKRLSAPIAGAREAITSRATFGRQIAVPRRKSDRIDGLHQAHSKDRGVEYIEDEEEYVPPPFIPQRKQATKERAALNEQVPFQTGRFPKMPRHRD